MNKKRIFFAGILFVAIVAGSVLSPLFYAQKASAAATISDAIEALDETVDSESKLLREDPMEAGKKMDIPRFIGYTIKRIMEITGAIFFAYLVYGAFLWMLSRGDSNKLKTARGTVYWAVMGMVIILISYVITSFLMNMSVSR